MCLLWKAKKPDGTFTISLVRNDNYETIWTPLIATQPFDELVKRKLISIISQWLLLCCQLMHPADQDVSTKASKFTASVDMEWETNEFDIFRNPNL